MSSQNGNPWEEEPRNGYQAAEDEFFPGAALPAPPFPVQKSWGKDLFLLVVCWVVFLILVGALAVSMVEESAVSENVKVCQKLGEYRDIWDMKLGGERLYISQDGGKTVVTLDVSLPKEPRQIGYYHDSKMEISALNPVGDLLYLHNGSQLLIMNFSNPNAPVHLSTYQASGDIRAATVDGDLLYLSDSYAGLNVVNISNKEKPELLWRANDRGRFSRVNVIISDGEFLYMGISGDNITIWDTSNQSDVRFLGEFESNGLIGMCLSQEDLVYLSIYSQGLQVLDVSNKSSPGIITSFQIPSVWSYTGYASSLEFSGDRLYLVNGGGGLVIMDVVNRTRPQTIGWYGEVENYTPFIGKFDELQVLGDYIFVHDNRHGLTVLKYEPGVIAYEDHLIEELVASFVCFLIPAVVASVLYLSRAGLKKSWGNFREKGKKT